MKELGDTLKLSHEQPLLFGIYILESAIYGMHHLLVQHQYSLVNEIGAPHE